MLETHLVGAVMIVDWISLFVICFRFLGFYEAKPTGIIVAMCGFAHVIFGLIATFTLGNVYLAFLIWVFAITFIYAGIVIAKEYNTLTLAHASFTLGTVVLVYAIHYTTLGLPIWSLILYSFVILYYMFTATLLGKLPAKATAYFAMFNALVCLVSGGAYLMGITFA
jgi:hypothetical protein